MRPSILSLPYACVAATPSGAAAGTVEVRFVNTGSYADAGVTAREEEANLKAIGQRSLPANHQR
ncbi:MAG: hypothetical protein WC657_08520 [Candidatus Paceibacterota bacterium]|jgi:hypothetical protein